MKKNYLLTFLLATCFFFKVSAQCPAPTNLAAFNISGTTARVAWTPAGSETAWEVELDIPGSPAGTNPGMIANGNPYVFTGLMPCTTYVFYVRAYCGPGNLSAWAGPFTFSTFSSLICTTMITQNITCNTFATITATASGGSGNYSYTLVDLTGGSTSQVNFNGFFSNVDYGIYDVILTDLQTNCSVTKSNIIIQQSTPLTCQAVLSGINPNTVTLSGSGGSTPYTYSIDGVTAFQASGVFTGLAPGTYNFLVKEANGCTCSSILTIQNNPFSVIIVATLDNPTSTLSANVVGGVAPYTYHWELNGIPIAGANGSTLVINGAIGLYSVNVTDSNSQVVNASFAVQNSQQIIANDDDITVCPSSATIMTSLTSVLSNDFLNGLPVNTQFSPSVYLTPLIVPAGFSLNTDGTVSVLSGTADGIYTLTYQICSATNPMSVCDNATVLIHVQSKGILMKAFIDSNNNNVQDSGEQNFILGQFRYERNNNGVVNNVYSSNGYYFINETNVATYDLSYTIDSPYNNQYGLTISSYADISFDPVSGIVIYNFPITGLPYTDLITYVTPNGAPPRPGFNYYNLITYKNSGNQAIAAGTITFTKNNIVTIIGVSQSGITPTATGFTYDFANLLPNETRQILVTMQVPTIPSVSLFQTLTNSVSSTIPAGDINVNNNSNNLTQVIVGSYDPNEITESHGDKIVYSTFTSNDYLNYTIQFENTGTFYAENVRVNDVLDAKLDETSVRMINASHANALNRVGNTLNWNFNGIDLQPGEKGYINFEVKPKAGYAVGDIIPNTASIYFDFNPAIVTNTCQTEFVTALTAPHFENAAFRVYPNPTNDVVTISLNENDKIDSVIVMDVLGKTVQTKTVNSAKATLDLSALTDGMYFLKVKANGLEKVMKIMKQ